MPYKTKYTPDNIKKYVGNSENINCKSLWERKMCRYLDQNKSILKWGYEIIKIPYLSPLDNKIHNYIPDFIIETINKEISILEVKPFKQTKDPSTKKRKKLNECLIYSVNKAKWDSATQYCKSHGWKFQIITEKDLF